MEVDTDTGGPEATGEDAETVSVKVAQVRSLVSALQCIRAGNKQVCNVGFSSEGMSVRWEDDSKALQGSVFLKQELFSDFRAPLQEEVFGLPLHALLDTLAVFASYDSGLALYYPGPNGELICESVDSSGGPPLSTWARISSLDAEVTHDLTDYWEEPSSWFMLPGSLFKEAVDDLEWPGGDVEVTMQRDPQAVRLKAIGHGTLEVELPLEQLSDFRSAQPEVAFAYKFKHMKAACSNLPSAKDGTTVSTKVSLDAKGLLKVTHRVTLGGAGGGGAGGGGGRSRSAAGGPDYASSALLESQRLADASKVAVVSFVVQPVDLDEGAHGG